MRKLLSVLWGGVLMIFLANPASGAFAANPQTSIPPNIEFDPMVSGLSAPVVATNAGDGSNRIFIVQQGGQILVYHQDTQTLNSTPFLNVSGLINCCGEQGLLGLAFDPHYSTNGYFYIVYTNTNNVGDDVLYRYHVSANPDVADASSAQLLLTVGEPESNHNGGNIAFGPDGYLYFGLGDGGGGGDQHGTCGNGQNKNTLLGKMLRINVDSTFPYAIPSDNPYAVSGGLSEIWAYGLRNPWRFSFDRSTGDLYIGDVGQNTEEEIDFQPTGAAGGRNYGWHIMEGNRSFQPASGPCAPLSSNYVPPVAIYDHGTNDSTGCAVTGGYVYRGSTFPGLVGVYLYGDYCSGKLWGLYRDAGNQWVNTFIANTGYNISAFGQDEAGELYILDYGGGQLVHITSMPSVTTTLYSQAAYDGSIRQAASSASLGGTVYASDPSVLAGNDPFGFNYRSILSFDTSAVPANAIFTHATLQILGSSAATIRGISYKFSGPLSVDMMKGSFGNNPLLASSDYQAPATISMAAYFSTAPTAGLYSTVVPPTAFGAINKLGLTQFRLYFALDRTVRQASFYSGDFGTLSSTPQLTLTYYAP